MMTLIVSGIVCRQIDQLLSGTAIEVPQLNVIQSTGQESKMERAQAYQSLPLSAPSDTGMLNLELESTANLVEAPTTSKIRSHNHHEDRDRLSLPQNAWTLLEHYFAFTQTWLQETRVPITLKLFKLLARLGRQPVSYFSQ